MSHYREQKEEKAAVDKRKVKSEPDEKQETYTPKMKPGDVEIPNRVFVKGFPKDTVANELFSRFEEFGKVIECRIVTDRYGNSKGFGFVTFDSQQVAETVRDMERIKFEDDVEVVIGPARIRKKKFYLLPGPGGWKYPQACYFQDGNMIVPASSMPPQQVLPFHSPVPGAPMFSNMPVASVIPCQNPPHPQTHMHTPHHHLPYNEQQTPNNRTPQHQSQSQLHVPSQHQQTNTSQQSPQTYNTPVIFSVVNDPLNMSPQSHPVNIMQHGGHPQAQYYTYQTCPPPAQLTPMMEKMSISQVVSPNSPGDDQEVPRARSHSSSTTSDVVYMY